MERVLGSRANRLVLRMICGGRHAFRMTWSGTGVSGPRIVHVRPELAGAAGGLVGGAERYSYELACDMARRLPTTLLTFGPERHDHHPRSSATRSRNTLPFGAHRQRVGPHSPRPWGRVTRKGCGKSGEVDS
jgi:hypothetical protein